MAVESISDSEMYREMCKPFESNALAQEALEAFFKELYDLRCKYKLADVSYVVSSSTVEGQFMTGGHLGNSAEAISMAAWWLGVKQAEQEEMISKQLSNGKKNGRSRK